MLNRRSRRSRVAASWLALATAVTLLCYTLVSGSEPSANGAPASPLSTTSDPFGARLLQAGSASPTPTDTASESPSVTDSVSDSATRTRTGTATRSRSATTSSTASRSGTYTRTGSVSSTATPSVTVTSTCTGTVTVTGSASGTPTVSTTPSPSPTLSPCPSAQFRNASLGVCVCTMANAIAVGSACVCAPGTHASGGACRFDAILSLSSPSTTVTEGGVAAWTLTLLQPQALTSSVVIDVIVTVSPGGLVTHSLIQFGRGRTSPQAMQVPVLRDGNADVTQRVNVSTALSGSSGTDPSFADPLVLPSILFLVLNADTCPLGQYWSGGGCVCVGANTALLAGVCGCANGYVSCGGMCVLASPLSLSAASVTVIEGASVNLSVSLAGSISDSSCVVAVSVTWLSGPARLTATPAGLVWAAGNATVPANITIALPRDGIVTGNATAVLSVAVSSSCGAFAPRVPVTVAVLAVDGDVPALLPSVPLLTLTDATGVLTLTLASGCVCDTSVAVSLSPPLSFLGVNTSQLDAAPFGSGDYFVPRVLTLFRRGSAPVDISSSTLTLTTVCASTGTAYPAAASVALTVYAYPVSLTLTPTQSPLVLWEGTTSTLTLALTHTPATPVSVSCAAVGGGVTVSVSPPSFLLNTTAPVGVNVTLLPDGLVTGNATLSLQCVCNDSGIVPPAPLLLLCVDADTAGISVDVADGASLAQGTTLYARVSLTPTLHGGVTLLMTVAGAGVSATFPNGLTVYTLPPLPAPWSPSLPFALTSSDADVWFGNRSVTVTITVLSAPADVAFTGLTVSRSLACVGPSPLLLLSVGPGVTQGANASLVIAASPSLRAYQYAVVALVCSSPLLRLSAASVVLNATWPSQSVSVWVAWSAGSAPLVITCVGTVAPSFSSTNAPAYFNASGSVTFTAAAATAAAAPGVLWDAALTGPLGGAIAGQAISVTITVYTPLTAPILFVWATNNAALPAGPPPQSTTVRVSAPPDTVCRGSRISTFTFSTLSSESAYAGLTRALSFTSRDQGTPGWYWGTGSVSVTAGGLGVNALLYLSCQYPFPVNLSIAPTPSLLFAVSPSLSALPALSSTPLVFSVIPAAASLPFPSSFLSAAVQLSLSGAPAGWPSPPPLPVSVSTPITASVLLSTIVGSVSEALLTQAAVVQVTLTAPVYAGDVTLGAVANATVTVTAVYASGHCIPSDVTQTVLLSLACNSDADCPTGGMTCMQHTKVIVSPPSLTFTSANWALGQSFHITPENDSVVEGPHFSLVTLIVSSVAVGYTNITLPRPVNISITDNDVAGVSVVTSGALPFKLYEPLTAGAPNSTLVTYVKLSGQPNRAITINITSSSPLLLAPVPSLLLFTPANWALPQPVALTALRDGVVQALSTRVNVSYAIALTPGVDAAFAAVARSASLPIVLTGSVIDADTASVVMSPLGLVLPGGMACVSALPATVSDAQCTSVCISSPAQCPSSLCDCVTNTSPVPSLLLSTSLVSASFTVTLTSTPLFPVTLSLLSSTATAINTTVDPCVGTASGVSVSWPQLLFTPPVVTFPANTTPVAMTVRVSGFPNGVPMGLVTATSRVSVSSHDPAYNITPGASLCPAGVVYGPSNSQGQCPPPPLPSLPFLLNTTLRPVPTLASATLDAAAGVSTLTFSAPVDSVGDVPCDAALAVDADIVPGACRSPLAVVTAAALGTGAVCAYVHTASGASVLRVQLGAGATLAPGMYVSVLPGLHASATDARTVVGRVSVQALLPSDPLTVSVYGATLIDACAGVALTALPSFPSPLVTVTWDILSLTTTAGPLPLPAALASAFPSSSSLLVLPPSALPAGVTLTLIVNASTPLLTASRTVTVVKGGDVAPVVWTDAPYNASLTVWENDGSALVGHARLSVCVSPGTPLSVYWLMTSGTPPPVRIQSFADGFPLLSPGGLDTRRLNLTGFPAGTYSVRLCAEACAPLCSSGCVDVSVIILPPALILTVNGVGNGSVVALPAGAAVLVPIVTDPSLGQAPLTGAVDVWTCDPPCVPVWNTGGNATVINVAINAPVRASLTRRYSDGRLAVWAGGVVLATGPPASITLTSTLSSSPVLSTGLDADEDLLLSVSVSGGSVTGMWTCVGCSAVLTAGLLPLPTSPPVFPLVTSLSLRVPRDATVPGDVLTLQYRAVGPSATSLTQTQLVYKSAPSCTLTQSQSGDEALLLLSVSDCGGPGSAYRYGLSASGGPRVWVGDWTPSPLLLLPSLPLGNWTLTLLLSSPTQSGTYHLNFAVSELDLTPWSAGAGLTEIQNALVDGGNTELFAVMLGWNQALVLSTALPPSPLFYQSPSDQTGDRSALVSQLPSLLSSLSNSDADVAVALSLIALSVSVPAQLSVYAGNSAVAACVSLLAPVSTLPRDSWSSVACIVSSLLTAQTLSHTDTAAAWMRDTGLSLLTSGAGKAAHTLQAGEAALIVYTPALSVAIGAPSVDGSLSMPISGPSPVHVTCPAGVAVCVAVAYVANPYANASGVWGGAVPVSPLVSVRLLSSSGAVVTASPLPAALTLTLPVALPSSTLTSSLVCVVYDQTAGVMSRVGCVTDATRLPAVTCACTRSGDVVVVATPAPGLRFSDPASGVRVRVLPVNRDAVIPARYAISLSVPPLAPVTVTVAAPSGYCVLPPGYTRVYGVVCATSADCAAQLGPLALCASNNLLALFPSRLTFSPTNWSLPQSVSVYGLNDGSPLPGLPLLNITHTLASADVGYDASGVCVSANASGACVASIGLPPIRLSVSLLTSATVGLEYAVAGGVVTQGSSALLSLWLPGRPFAPVCVTLHADANDILLSDSVLWFLPSTFDTPHTITLTAVATAVNMPSPRNISISVDVSSADTDYDGVDVGPVNVTVIGPIAAVVTNTTAVTLTRSGPAVTLTVSLSVIPASTVTLLPSLPSSLTGALTFSPSSLTVTRGAWAGPFILAITPANSGRCGAGVSVNGTVLFAVFGADTAFTNTATGASVGVFVRLIDDVTPKLLLQTAIRPLVLSPGALGTYSAVLACAPAATVTVTLSITLANATTRFLSMPAPITLSPSVFTFTAATWATPVAVSVSVSGEAVAWPPGAFVVTHTLTSSDAMYAHAPPATLLLQVPGVNLAPIALSPSALALTKGGSSGGLDVVLPAAPLGDGVVMLAVTHSPRVSCVPDTLTFTAQTWSLPQSVTCIAPDDHVDQPAPLPLPLTLSVSVQGTNDTAYLAAASDVTSVCVLTVTDSPGTSILLSPSAVSVNESVVSSMHTAIITLSLSSQPLTTLTLTPASSALGVYVSLSPVTVTFSPSNWSQPQTITVTALDDSVYTGPSNTYTLTLLVSASPVPGVDMSRYALAPPALTVTVWDADHVGVSLSPATLTLTRAAPWSLLSCRLSSSPTSPVTVTLTSSSPSLIALNPPTLTIPPSLWATVWVVNASLPPTATLTARAVTVTLTAAVTAADTFYAGLTAVSQASVASGTHAPPVIVCVDEVAVTASPLPALVIITAAQSYDPDGEGALTYTWAVSAGSVSVTAGGGTHTLTLAVPAAGVATLTVTAVSVWGVASTHTVIVWAPAVTSVAANASCYQARECVTWWSAAGVDASRANVTLTASTGGVMTSIDTQPASAGGGVYVWPLPDYLPLGEGVLVFSVYLTFTLPSTMIVASAASPPITITSPHAWQPGAYGQCVGGCGDGERTRPVPCVDVSGPAPLTVPDAVCASSHTQPPVSQWCYAGNCPGVAYAYAVGDAVCNADCGVGTATRSVVCYDALGAPVSSALCAGVIGPAPDTSLPCDAGACDSPSPLTVTVSPCTAVCGGGRLLTTTVCVNNATGIPSVCAGAPPPSSSSCNTRACGAGYRWLADWQWGQCSAECGGGVATRTVTCVRVSDGAVSINPSVDCDGLPVPVSSRPCATHTCVPLSLSVSPWSACTHSCGGNRTRTVACVRATVNGSSSVDVSVCVAAGLPLPPTTETCTQGCGFCNATQCSGHGACNATAGVCVCEQGWGGQWCESSESCVGPTDLTGVCCGPRSVLDTSYRCCAGVLDARGLCCVSGVLNACGVCDGPVRAVTSAVGVCCDSGVLDAAGGCCVSGVLDAVGVCDGMGVSVVAVVTGTLTLTTQTSPQALSSVLAVAWGRNQTTLALWPPLALQTAVGPGGANITLSLLPFGGPNTVDTYTLQAALPPSFPLTLTSISTHTQCGNGVCETGERPAPGAGVSGCPADCPLPLAPCPLLNGTVCGGAGVCVHTPGGIGVCVCWSAAGASGPVCDSCLPGFVAHPHAPFGCAVMEAPVALWSPTPSATVSPTHMNVTAIGGVAPAPFPLLTVAALGGVGVLVCGFLSLWACRTLRRKFTTVADSSIDLLSKRDLYRLSPSPSVRQGRRVHTAPGELVLAVGGEEEASEKEEEGFPEAVGEEREKGEGAEEDKEEEEEKAERVSVSVTEQSPLHASPSPRPPVRASPSPLPSLLTATDPDAMLPASLLSYTRDEEEEEREEEERVEEEAPDVVAPGGGTVPSAPAPRAVIQAMLEPTPPLAWYAALPKILSPAEAHRRVRRHRQQEGEDGLSPLAPSPHTRRVYSPAHVDIAPETEAEEGADAALPETPHRARSNQPRVVPVRSGKRGPVIRHVKKVAATSFPQGRA